MVNVIDAPCGAGKSTRAIQYIMEHPAEKIVYVTPFLNEIDRVREKCGKWRIQEPEHYIFDENGESHYSAKIDCFNHLLACGQSVATTHTTFLNATAETIAHIKDNGYTLILDEALDVIGLFNNVANSAIKYEDIKQLIRNGYISIDEERYNRITWSDTATITDWAYSELEKYIKLGNLFWVNKKDLVVCFSPEIFRAFQNSFVLTYMFTDSWLRCYFDKFGIEYRLCSLDKESKSLDIIDYTPDAEMEFIQKVKPLITIADGKSYSNRYALSIEWYKNATSSTLKSLSDSCHTVLVKHHKAKAADIMITSPKEKESALRHYGMVRSGVITKDEKDTLPVSKLREREKEIKCFVPMTAKATNIYKGRWALAYCVNVFINPIFEHFIKCNENGRIQIDEDKYALSYMIQWVWRSCIRDNKPIVLYVPSARMRGILQNWLIPTG